MPFGFGRDHGGSNAAPANGVRATALVVETKSPIEGLGALQAGSDSWSRTRILVDLGGGPVIGMRDLPLDPDHWLTVGMTIPVIVDPTDHDEYAVDWALIPPMAQRAAQNETSLVDPLGANLRVWDAMTAAGFHPLELDRIPARAVAAATASIKAGLDEDPRALARQLVGVNDLSAPLGYRRALVLIASTTATFIRDYEGTGTRREIHGKHSVVLSVNVPGEPPYALLVNAFDHELRIADPEKPGIPALVSRTDATAVQVLWDELPSQQNQADEVKDRVHEARAAEREAKNEGAVDPSVPTPPAGSAVSAAPSGMSPELKARMAAIAQKALAGADPATRQSIIDSYRASGIDLEG